MSEARLEGLRRELARDPRNPGVWGELGRVCARADRLPRWLAGDGVGSRACRDAARDLCHAWIASPEEPAMRDLLLRILEWEEVSETPSPWWEAQGRLERQGERCYDLATGLPLAARRRRDGAVVLLVPEGPFDRGSRSEAQRGDAVRVPPPDRWDSTPLDPFYLDREPVTVVRFAGWPAPGVRPGAEALAGADWEAQAKHPQRPVVALPWEVARGYAAWVGGELPLVLEWERAATGDHRRTFPFAAGSEEVSPFEALGSEAELAYDRYYDDEYRLYVGEGEDPVWAWSAELQRTGERNRGPFGHRGLAGNVAEWCQDRRGETAATKGGSWMSPRAHLAICHTAWQSVNGALPMVGFRVAHRLFGEQGSLFPGSRAETCHAPEDP